MKRTFITLSVFFLATFVFTNCSREDQQDYLRQNAKTPANSQSGLLTKGDNGKDPKTIEKEYNEKSRSSFAKLHKKLVKAYYKNQSGGKGSFKAEVADSLGLGIPVEALALEMTEEMAMEYIGEMYIPSYSYLSSNFELDFIDELNDRETILLAIHGASLKRFDEAGYQVDGYYTDDTPWSLAVNADTTSTVYRLGVCLNKALGTAAILAIKNINFNELTTAESLVLVRKAMLRSVGFYITAAVMAYEFGVCMGWLYDIFGHDKV